MTCRYARDRGSETHSSIANSGQAPSASQDEVRWLEKSEVQRGSAWWVGFTETDNPRWWRHFSPPGFRHCFAFTTAIEGLCHVMNPRETHLEVELVAIPSQLLCEHFLGRGARLVFVEPRESAYTLPRRWLVQTCATVIAYHLGLNTGAVTPYQLYRHCLAIGGTELEYGFFQRSLRRRG